MRLLKAGVIAAASDLAGLGSVGRILSGLMQSLHKCLISMGKELILFAQLHLLRENLSEREL